MNEATQKLFNKISDLITYSNGCRDICNPPIYDGFQYIGNVLAECLDMIDTKPTGFMRIKLSD